MLETLLPFLGACLLIALSPGPSTVLIISNSLRGRRAGLLTVLGNETGVFLWGVVAACGLTALLAASQVAYDVMRYAGAAVLIVFGVQTLRAARRGGDVRMVEPGGAAAEGTGQGERMGQGEGAEQGGRAGHAEGAGQAVRAVPALRAYSAGLLMNLANPKAAIFAVSFLPQFVPSGAPQLPAMIALAAVWAVFETGYYSLYVWGVGRLRALLSRKGVRRRLEQVSGGVLLVLGVRLALES